MFDVEKYPVAIYEGLLTDFQDGGPTKVKGKLTLHGITKEVDLDIKTFKCKMHPFKLKEVCGADAYGNIMRDDFDISYGKLFGFKMDVALRIGVEAIKMNLLKKRLVTLAIFMLFASNSYGNENFELTSPEGWAMAFMNASAQNLGQKPPRSVNIGDVSISAELSSIPYLSKEQQRIGFGGSKDEDLNKTPVFEG